MTDKLTYGMILAAKLGDPQAIAAVLKHYERQIKREALRCVSADATQLIKDALTLDAQKSSTTRNYLSSKSFILLQHLAFSGRM